MTQENLTVRGVSDTARWVEYFRARETQRPNAWFRNPYAECRAPGRRAWVSCGDPAADGNKHEQTLRARTYFSIIPFSAQFRQVSIWW
jgi:O-methyltransferase involved in polyketide biosynthesis